MYRQFSQALPVAPHPETDAIFRRCLEKAQCNMPSECGSGYLPQDVGLFLAQSLCLLDFLADDLVQGQHMTTHTRTAVEQLEFENDLSELDSLEKLMEMHAILRKMCKRIHEASKEVRLLWNEAPSHSPPEMGWVDLGGNLTTSELSLSVPSSDNFIPELGSSVDAPMAAPTGTQNQEPPKSPDLFTLSGTDRQHETANYLDQWTESLKSRGTGNYTCNHGISCEKGGVQNGELVVFTRNSEIRAHLEKHIKPYKCTLPNCPTRKGFSRPDQLKRHQRTVDHTGTN